MEWFILWLALSLIPAVIASKRGREGIGWFFIGVLISPLLATVILFAVEDLSKRQCPACGQQIPVGAQVCPFCKKDLTTQSVSSAGEFKPDALSKKCPDCAETIKLEALVCRFCGHRFEAAEVQAAIQQARSEFEQTRSTLDGTRPLHDPRVGRPCPKCNSVSTIAIAELPQNNSRMGMQAMQPFLAQLRGWPWWGIVLLKAPPAKRLPSALMMSGSNLWLSGSRLTDGFPPSRTGKASGA